MIFHLQPQIQASLRHNTFSQSESGLSRITEPFVTYREKSRMTIDRFRSPLTTIKGTQVMKKNYESQGKPWLFPFSWEQRKLSEYLDVSNEKNTEDVYTKQDVLSVSGDYGIVNQIKFQGRSFAGASVSNYGVVYTGDVVYTKSPLNSNPYGIIKTNKGKPGIVSTLYAVYHPKENVDPAFVQTYFEQHARMNNYMHPLVNKGAKNDMKVSSENALKGDVVFPDIAEQRQIVALFVKLDHLITLHQRERKYLDPEVTYARSNKKNRFIL